ncbi:MAG: LysR family transcriptional regulator [Lawsonibacter sp.]|nr:LysR family transcriptional regulator [Lawsonibacter sp.]
MRFENIGFRLMEYIVALGEEENFTRAAHKLYISQPSLSQAIKRIEEESGIQLFFRDRGRVLPTEEGTLFIATGKRMIKLMRDLENELLDRSKLNKGSLVIGTGYMLGAITVFEQVAKFREQHAEIDLRLVEAGAPELEAKTIDGSVDICFVFQPLREHGLCVKTLSTGKMVLVMSKKNPLNRYAFHYPDDPNHLCFDLKKARKASFICPTEGNRIDQMSNQIFKMAGFIPFVSMRIRNIGTSVRLVGSSNDLVILPDVFLHTVWKDNEDAPPVNSYYLNRENDQPWTLVAAYSKDIGHISTVAQTFINMLDEQIWPGETPGKRDEI